MLRKSAVKSGETKTWEKVGVHNESNFYLNYDFGFLRLNHDHDRMIFKMDVLLFKTQS